MSRLTLTTKDQAQETIEILYKDLERRIEASQPGLCPVDLAEAFVHMCHAQSCGKCTPCRIGLGQLGTLINDVLDGKATMETLDTIEHTAESIFYTADCAIGSEAARMVLKGIRGFRDEYESHINEGKCGGSHHRAIPCISMCPAHVDIPGYIALIHEGRYEDAVNLIRKDNPFPAACGLICEHPCESNCRRTMVDDPINIRGLKRYAVEHEGDIKTPKIMDNTGKKVAIVGGGPGGLSAAYYLAIMGHDVTVYEQRKQLGGMLRYGIPTYRLPVDILDKEINGILSTGIKTKMNVSVGTDISLADLLSQNDAVFVSIGAHTDKKIGIEGEDAEGVTSAVEMLRAIGDQEPIDYTGQDVIVVGGGNVSMDVARSAVRLGAKSVKVVYRRRIIDMTALDEEIYGAIADGCEILELNSPVRIEKDANGKVEALVVQPQLIGEINKGRASVKTADTPEVAIKCDQIIVAIGQGIDSSKLEESGVHISRGHIEALDTSDVEGVDGLFAGGDCVTGPATVIKAIAAGKVAAANIDEYLGYNHVIDAGIELPRIRFSDHEPCARVNMREIAPAERVKSFDLMEIGMTDEEACQESGRCLHCDHFGYGSFRGGRREKW